MDNSFYINSVAQAHQALGLSPPKHPLVTVVQAKEVQQIADFQAQKIVTNLYQILYKDGGCGTLTYGRNSYDYEAGSLLFTAPGQTMQYDQDIEAINPESGDWTLAFHPDLIRKSELGKKISQYSFFNYEVNEALHLSTKERQTIKELLDKIVTEYSQNLDRHSQHLIISNIQLLLDYCLRFYDRQFYTRTNLNSDIISRFESLLHEYYQTDKAIELGMPNVSYCAEALHLSPNYLSDLLKKETGKTAQEHIHLYVIERAKNTLLNSRNSISEIAYALGFGYPQHFSSLFKAKTGISPREYRNLN